MLKKFEVTNFKSFNEKFVFDLSDTRDYQFNPECVVNGIVNKSLIYGHNGMGKSNLGFAIFDIVSHMTDKQVNRKYYLNYLNASNISEEAHFKYVFHLHTGSVVYEYGKKEIDLLTYEKLTINGKVFASISRNESFVATINAVGAENLKTDLTGSIISIISYIEKNSLLDDNLDNKCFNEFLEFVNGMLFFRSLNENDYMGFEQGNTIITKDIIEKGNISKFEKFLNDAGIECKLVELKVQDHIDILFDFGGKNIPFYSIASQGTKALALFYFWFQRLSDESKVKFVFIDEFDAFYHFSLSKIVVEALKKISAQVIITTHNTSIMSNDLLRPDCYFLINKKNIRSLSSRTQKELREAHNIEKMYIAGSFNE